MRVGKERGGFVDSGEGAVEGGLSVGGGGAGFFEEWSGGKAGFRDVGDGAGGVGETVGDFFGDDGDEVALFQFDGWSRVAGAWENAVAGVVIGSADGGGCARRQTTLGGAGMM